VRCLRLVQADRGEDLGRIWKRGPVLPPEKIAFRDPNEPKRGGLRKIVRKATDEDLRAIFAYLQTLAPVKHRVDNDLEPTPCRICGLAHGGGDKNIVD